MRNKELATIVDYVLQDKEANFKELFNAISETIYYMAYKILKDPNDAEDAAQEIILYIYSHLEEVRNSEAFNQWMNKVTYGICNRSLSKILKAKDNLQEKEMESLLETDKDKLPEAYLEDLEDKEALLNIVNSLSEKQRDVVLLYYYQDLSAKEAAKILDCSVAAVKDRLVNAKKALRFKVKQSAYFKKERLFNVSLLPLFMQAMLAESKDVYEGKIASHLWANVSRHIASQAGLIKDKELNSNKKRIYLFLSLILVAGTVIGALSFCQHQKEKEDDRCETWFYENTILDKIGKNTQKTEESSDETENLETEHLEIEHESSTEQSLLMEEKTEDTKLISNTAILEDDKQDMIYEVPIDGNDAGDPVFSEDDVKTTSNSTYHEFWTPRLTFEKMASKEAGAASPGTGDRYDMMSAVLLLLLSMSILVVVIKKRKVR